MVISKSEEKWMRKPDYSNIKKFLGRLPRPVLEDIYKGVTYRGYSILMPYSHDMGSGH